ncbi:MAG: DUF6353 family protein [Bacteroidota bacterium]|nr:DUF6353 family protein [Bacteroidota bacterium]
MNKSKSPVSITDGYNYMWNQAKYNWQRNSGKILTVAGTTGLFLAGIHSNRKTYKIHDELAENGKRISDAKKPKQDDKWYSRGSRVTKEIAKATVKSSRHYILDAIAGGLSAYAISKGWQTEHKHYKQAATMVGLVMADFMNYRGNVIAEQGEEADRRYLTSKRSKAAYISANDGSAEVKPEEGDEHIVSIDENSLRIWYSRETTPQVWSDSLTLRILHLQDIENRLNLDLRHGGSYSVNDVRRYFYGRKGDVAEGGMFGRIWDPGDPEHPERGAFTRLHYDEDEDFMEGRTEGCWIIIDIDSEPLFELMKRKKEREYL